MSRTEWNQNSSRSASPGLAVRTGLHSGTLVNINTADAETLSTLKYIGPTIAYRIVEYRVMNGPFRTPEDIMNVKGVGQKTFDAIRDQIVVW